MTGAAVGAGAGAGAATLVAGIEDVVAINSAS